ncbi:MAG TPA: polyprenyl diphosphate synthase [Candidatus Sulfotelmatobacter sp.]|jgi:undecaprenyl diphosphate synthase|nr:polyprenyl diphosphate synthase [Candidatus Sulfotelmatobacter sp.]
MIQHVALIMDGNRRWAKEKKLPTVFGHQKGYKQIEKIVESAQEHEINYVTFWAFSTENWKRNEEEVSHLMNLFRKALKSNLFKKLMRNNCKICILGNLNAFPKDIQSDVAEVVEESKNNRGIQINIALNYGGREEIVHAVQQIISDNVDQAAITNDLISQYLYTKDQPDPDLIIRTGGAQRLSGYLPWQSTYSELYFTDTYWPDFDGKAFDKAIKEFEKRERRFGK